MHGYLVFVGKRLLQLLAVIFCGVSATFLVTHLSPISPVEAALGRMTARSNSAPEAIVAMREALTEREILWSIAPHIIRPMRFILPHTPDLRPRWMLRLALFLYDHIGGKGLIHVPLNTFDPHTAGGVARRKADLARGIPFGQGIGEGA